MTRKAHGRFPGPESRSRRSHSLLGFLLVWATVLAIMHVGGRGAHTEAAGPSPPEVSQAFETVSEWGYRAYLPLVKGERYILDTERYGFVAMSANWRQKFDVARLGSGWYVDADPPACLVSPDGMDRAALIWVHEWATNPRWEWLESMVKAHPRSMWLVGNEPDCIWQDGVLPEVYAEVYHDIYARIKGLDPSAVVSPGGIVQPTPLRLQWLDRVLAEYEATYGSPMPVDVWNIHNAILREARGDWGADIPPGFDWIDVGVWREVEDNDDLEIFRQQIWDFREWMASRGYAGWPLIVSEFGVLMPVEFGFGVDRVNAFMDATFEFLRTARSTDPDTLGDPSDDYHLVQRWAWFSLDNPPYDPEVQGTFNGNLFNPDTTEITSYGLNFRTHTRTFSPPDYVELRPSGIRFEPLALVGEGEPVSRRVEVEVRNLGTLDSGSFVVSLAYVGPSSGELMQTIALPAGSGMWLAFDLVQLESGVYEITVLVDAEQKVPEATECDNALVATMLVPSEAVRLPLLIRQR